MRVEKKEGKNNARRNFRGDNVKHTPLKESSLSSVVLRKNKSIQVFVL